MLSRGQLGGFEKEGILSEPAGCAGGARRGATLYRGENGRPACSMARRLKIA